MDPLPDASDEQTAPDASDEQTADDSSGGGYSYAFIFGFVLVLAFIAVILAWKFHAKLPQKYQDKLEKLGMPGVGKNEQINIKTKNDKVNDLLKSLGLSSGPSMTAVSGLVKTTSSPSAAELGLGEKEAPPPFEAPPKAPRPPPKPPKPPPKAPPTPPPRAIPEIFAPPPPMTSSEALTEKSNSEDTVKKPVPKWLLDSMGDDAHKLSGDGTP